MMFRLSWWVVLMWSCVLGVAPLPAVEVLTGPEVVAQGDGARVRWSTDVPCGTRLKYGLRPEALDLKADKAGVRQEHEVQLSGLAAGKTYHFQVGTARVILKSGHFVAGGGAETGMPGTQTPAAPGGKEVEREVPRQPTSAPASPLLREPPPARITWGNLETLQDHFDRHGADFKASSPEDYASQAWRFLQRAVDEGLPAKIDDSDGTIRVYDPKTGSFAAYHANGRTKTFFKPGSPGYWQRQPGRPSKLRRNE